MYSIETPEYPILMGSVGTAMKEIDFTGYSSIVVIVDENTKKHCYPLVETFLPTHSLITCPAGEPHKNLDTASMIWSEMAQLGLDRSSLCINLGGGVVTDMGGFAAACYMRGIAFLHIPTTLLSQVDASIGGKLGVDHDDYKNIVGLFGHPQMVIIDSHFLKTLDPRNIRSGYAEIIKHGLIRDAAYYRTAVDAWHDDLATQLESIIKRSIEIKRDIVIADAKEKGERKLLNFGHTIGHAIESLALHTDTPLYHGEAIAIGMIMEAHLSFQKRYIDQKVLDTIRKDINAVYGSLTIPMMTVNEVWQVMQKDKKNYKGSVRCTLLKAIGEGCFDVEITQAAVKESWDYYWAS